MRVADQPGCALPQPVPDPRPRPHVVHPMQAPTWVRQFLAREPVARTGLLFGGEMKRPGCQSRDGLTPHSVDAPLISPIAARYGGPRVWQQQQLVAQRGAANAKLVLHTGDVVGFAFRQPVVVADLALLRGPLTGVWRLPRTLDSSALQSRDLADPAARQLAYEVVLREADDERDITEWVDRDELLRLWSRLYLPRQVRAGWEEHHAVLREIGAGPDVPHAYQAATAVAAGSGLLANG